MGEFAGNLPVLITLIGVFTGAFVAGFAGFGLSAAAGAFLLHVMPAPTAVPLMMLCSVVVQVICLVYLRKTMDFRGCGPFLICGAPAVPISVWILTNTHPELLRRVFGAFLVLYCGYMLWRSFRKAVGGGEQGVESSDAQKPARLSALGNGAFGFAGGLIGGLTAMPGATITIWADIRGGSKTDRRAIFQPFILAMQVVASTNMAITGHLFQPELLHLFVLSIPGMLIGVALGLFLFDRVASESFRVWVLALILFSGAVMALH
ncbi:MAG: sulfite exporter TauE/SafE family protein [Pseudomonadota bacterium]